MACLFRPSSILALKLDPLCLPAKNSDDPALLRFTMVCREGGQTRRITDGGCEVAFESNVEGRKLEHDRTQTRNPKPAEEGTSAYVTLAMSTLVGFCCNPCVAFQALTWAHVYLPRSASEVGLRTLDQSVAARETTRHETPDLCRIRAVQFRLFFEVLDHYCPCFWGPGIPQSQFP